MAAPGAPRFRRCSKRESNSVRARNVDEIKRFLAAENVVSVGLKIDSSWSDPKNGIIEGADPPTDGHCVAVIGYDDATAQLTFVNSWGADWGREGYAELAYDYMEERMVESWSLLHTYHRPGDAGILEELWGLSTPLGVVDGRGIYDADNDERLCWSFMRDQAGRIEVEEFFVRPVYRGRGHGKRLADLCKEVAEEAEKPLKMYLPFADIESATSEAGKTILNKLGLELQDSSVTWAAFEAV